MRGLICFNYLAGEAVKTGDVVALAFDQVKSYQHVIRRALPSDDPIGVALSDQEQGRAITVAAFVTGQSVRVSVAGNVIKGDQLAIDDNGDIVAFTGGEGQRALPLMALAASTGAGLIPAVCADCLTEAGGGAEFTEPVVMQDDLTVNGDTVLKGLTSSNLHMAAQSKIYFGEKSFGKDDLGGASFATDASGFVAIGSCGFFVVENGGSLTWAKSPGEEVEITGSVAAKIPYLTTQAGSGSASAAFYQATGLPDTQYPAGTKLKLITGGRAVSGGAALVFAIRTA